MRFLDWLFRLITVPVVGTKRAFACAQCEFLRRSNERLERRVHLLCRAFYIRGTAATAPSETTEELENLREVAKLAQRLAMHHSIADSLGAEAAMAKLNGALDRAGYGWVNHP